MGPQATDNENVEPKEKETSETTETTSSDGNETQPKTTGNEGSGRMYTEAEYKGLQVVIAKRDKTIDTLTKRNQQLEAEKAEAEANHGSAVTEKTSLSQELTEKSSKVAELEKEVADLQKKIDRNKIIMSEFNDLAPHASLIPQTETEEELRERAEELRKAISTAAKKRVTETLSGASPPLESSEERTTPGVDPIDEAYSEAMQYAGDPTKTKEYNEAYNKYLDLLDTKNN